MNKDVVFKDEMSTVGFRQDTTYTVSHYVLYTFAFS